MKNPGQVDLTGALPSVRVGRCLTCLFSIAKSLSKAVAPACASARVLNKTRHHLRAVSPSPRTRLICWLAANAGDAARPRAGRAFHRARRLGKRPDRLDRRTLRVAAVLARCTQLIFHGVILAWALNPDVPISKAAEEVWDLFGPNLCVAKPRRDGRNRRRMRPGGDGAE